jgi:hypothetical protein
MKGHLARLAVVYVLAGAVYAQVTGAFYCGYDDFLVVHRTAFEDTQNPSRMFTTSHFDSQKYRPVERAVDYITFHLGDGRPLLFRLRSLGSHFVVVAAVYALALMLFASPAVAFSAALLFSIFPLANQSVVACSWPITCAGALTLTSLVLFIRSVRDQGRRWLWLTLSLAAGWITIFYYEAGVAVFALMYGYLALDYFERRRVAVPPRFLVVLTVVVALIGVTLMAARNASMTIPPERVRIGTMVKNAAFYGGGLLSSPVDSVLAHDLFDTPLPSEMRLDSSAIVPVSTSLVVLAIGAILLLRALRSGSTRKPFVPLVALAIAAVILLIPFLRFTPHASETYLYLPSAMFCTILAAFLHLTVRRPWGYAACVAVLAVVFGAATYNRNHHVATESVIANRILLGLPISQWKQGSWQIQLAEADPSLPRFGMYEYQGLATIDIGDPKLPAAECALQLATRNQALKVRVVPATEMRFGCAQPVQCFSVDAGGAVSMAGGS